MKGFEEANKKIPNFIRGFDPLAHKTTGDLKDLVQFEIDLYEEGEPESDIVNEEEYKQAKKFVKSIRKEI